MKHNAPLVPSAKVASPVSAVAIVLALLAAILALTSVSVWQNYKSALAAGEARALSSAHVVAAHIQWMIEASDQALERIDAALGEEPFKSSSDIIGDISKAVGDLPAGFQYSVYDPSGSLRSTSVRSPVAINVSDRDYFRQLAQGKSIVISQQLTERLSGKSVFIIGKRLTRAGLFQGVASIAIETAAVDTFWSSMALGPHSTVSVVGEDGWLVVRHPAFDKPLDLSKTPLFTTFLPRSAQGFYHNAVSPADGKARIVGYWKVDGWPLIATAGVERGEALELFWSGLKSELLLGIPIVILLGLGLYWIARLLRDYALRNAELQQAVDANQFLMREIHHRVKNNLQAVSSLINLQPLPKDAKADMARRIAAMVAVHEQIYGSDQFQRVQVAPYAERLINEIAAAYPGTVKLNLGLESLEVQADQALPIGMIINEVVSNAFKYAFNGRNNGELSVRLTHDNANAFLSVADDGPGIEADTARTGMGSRLIAGFVGQLGGTYTLESSSGTVFAMTFPVRE